MSRRGSLPYARIELGNVGAGGPHSVTPSEYTLYADAFVRLGYACLYRTGVRAAPYGRAPRRTADVFRWRGHIAGREGPQPTTAGRLASPIARCALFWAALARRTLLTFMYVSSRGPRACERSPEPLDRRIDRGGCRADLFTARRLWWQRPTRRATLRQVRWRSTAARTVAFWPRTCWPNFRYGHTWGQRCCCGRVSKSGAPQAEGWTLEAVASARPRGTGSLLRGLAAESGHRRVR